MAPVRAILPAICLTLLAASAPPQLAVADEYLPPTVIQDPQYGEVLFYFYQEDYFPAIVRLLAAQKQAQFNHHGGEAELLLGGLYLSYGNHLRAAEIFEQLLAGNVRPEVRDRTWFFLAKIWQQRGYLEESASALANIRSSLPGSMEAERRMLAAQLMIDGGDYASAIGQLGNWADSTEWASYARFNLAVALVRSGQVNSAAAMLDEIGRMDPFNEELRSLKDRANLALGYAYLQDGQPLAAKLPLQRVRLNGPFSNKALLGVGWADAEVQDFRRALVPWMELKDRDLLDSAVQESMLAIPYAMAKLDSISQAADHYLNAVEAFYEESRRIDRMIDLIESGDLFEQFLAQDPAQTSGWFWRLDDLPRSPETRYLYHLLASHEFQEGLKNYRDLDYLTRNLDRWQSSVGVYRNMLDTRQLAYDERLPRVEASLEAADLDALVERKLELDARLNIIEENADFLALATKREFEQWGEITALERNPALGAEMVETVRSVSRRTGVVSEQQVRRPGEADEARHKLRLLKGVLQWDLEKEFQARLWSVRRDLRQAGEALVEAQRARRQIDESMRDEPAQFASLDARVSGLSPQIDTIKARVDAARERQLGFLRRIAVADLEAQKRRLDTYTVQARFALAAIYDMSATVGASTQ
ncbi:MAG: tetratricopeptide repeat protein [Gammaproteobacteria bacterium]|nr:tetratricopeptide repeat protein [Gammaproteobacteria bacterium]MDH5308789.1 tetratricopeptide repeat protein [Gammaproteobacteria bacterium]